MRVAVIFAALFVAAQVCEGAALVRFINTVPTRTATYPAAVTGGYAWALGAVGATTGTAYVQADNFLIDRVGLYYYAPNAAGSSISSATIVWTEPANTVTLATDATYGTANTPFAYLHAMPPLRPAHSAQLVSQATANGVQQDQLTGTTSMGLEDYLSQSAWKADGVGLYLTFAAGTYNIQAYGIMSGATVAAAFASSNPRLSFAATNKQFTFTDGKVYTLVALGDGQYGATPIPLTGNTVQLQLFEESTAPATFGMASIRWFHAIKNYASSSITVYNGDTTNNALATGISFGGLSNYVDVAPNLLQVFPITASAVSGTVIAPTSADKYEVTHDLRAGLRATIICAQANEADQKVFCRMIPSRVVAYVRLVNDLGGSLTPTIGAFSITSLKYVNLNLFASYEYPRPEQLYELSQSGGQRSLTNTPSNIRGLYKVVTNVAASTASGYGEVFVPLFVMDFAVRPTVIGDTTNEVGAAYAGYTANNNQAVPAATNTWFWGAPIAKRVHFVVKTDGGATLSGLASSVLESNLLRAPQFGLLYAGAAVSAPWFQNFVTIDKFIEPGQYYTLFVAANTFVSGATAIPTTGTVPRTNEIVFSLRLDRTLAQISSGVPSGKAFISWIPFSPYQSFGQAYIAYNSGAGVGGTYSTINLRPADASVNTNQQVNGLNGGTAATTLSTTPATTDYLNTAPQLTPNAGSYTFDFTASASATCGNSMPGSTSVTLAAGDIWDVYVLNVYGCVLNSNNYQQLVVLPVKTQSALATGNAADTILSPATTSTSTSTYFFAAAPALSVSMSFIIATIFAAVAALL